MNAQGENLGAVESFVSARGFYHEAAQQNHKKLARAALQTPSSLNDKECTMSYETIVTQLQAFYSFLSREPLAAVLLLELGHTLAGAVAS